MESIDIVVRRGLQSVVASGSPPQPPTCRLTRRFHRFPASYTRSNHGTDAEVHTAVGTSSIHIAIRPGVFSTV